jgi:hypothetical protein
MNPKWTPVACERCGSLYFYQAEFRQYREMLYSSGAVGGLSVSAQSQQIRICICGEPRPDAGQRSGEDAHSFEKCVVVAKALRAKQQPEALLQELLAELATKKELAEAQERLASLEQALQAITAGEKKR